MSRVAKAPVTLPDGVECNITGRDVEIKGKTGRLQFQLPDGVDLKVQEGEARAEPVGRTKNLAMAGTVRSLVQNMVTGVSEGFERRLELVGVGYRAQAQGDKINLSLGLSHSVTYQLPEGVKAETPSQTEIVLKASDRQQLGQAAADIREFRPPEPYKGKGIRFADETVVTKEAKKK